MLSLVVVFSVSPTQQKLENESDLCHRRIWEQISSFYFSLSLNVPCAQNELDTEILM